MVRMPARLSMLDRKLLRDLWEMKGQSLAIAAVIASGVTMFVAMLSNFDSLWRMRADFYERARFADVFAGSSARPRACSRAWPPFPASRPWPLAWSPRSRSMCPA